MKVKNISEYPFIDFIYNYMAEAYLIETEKATEVREKLDEIINKLFGYDIAFELDWLITLLEGEQHSAGFLNGYIAAVMIMNGQTIFKKS